MWLLSVVCIGFSQPNSENIRIVASGDTLVHWRVKKTARTKNVLNTDGTTINHGGFDWILEDVAPVFQKADIGFVNLETPTDPDMHTKIHGEILNAPVVFLDALKHAGINIVSFANNHSFDQGPIGMMRTIQELEQRAIMVVGSGKDCRTAHALQIKEVRGVRVGFLAMTDLMNINDNTIDAEPCVALPGPVCQEDCVPDRDALWYHIEEASVISSIRQAKSQVDILVFSFHWGTEYRLQPLPLYSKLAPKMMEAGVDVLLGHHSHTLQPIVQYTKKNGNEGVIVYSLGNLFSDMSRKYGRYPKTTKGKTRDGMLLAIDISLNRLQDEMKRIRISHVEIIPLWTENNNNAELPGIRPRRHSTILKENAHRQDFIDIRKRGIPSLEYFP